MSEKPTHEPWDFVVSAKVGGYVVTRQEKRPDGEYRETEFVASDRSAVIRHFDQWLDDCESIDDAREEAERALKKKD